MADGAQVHPSSVVEDGAILGEGTRIGPFCHVGSQVVLGRDCELLSHAVVAGDTVLGDGCKVFPFASIGHVPQDLKYAGEPVRLRIGVRGTFREGVTVNPGTAGDRALTQIGDDCLLLANAHVAHDCSLGDRVIFSNNVMLAGHCTVGDGAILGGGAAVHQFSRIGRHAFIGGMAGVEGDVIPFGMALGNRAYLGGLNLIGMKRAGIPRVSIGAVRAAYKRLFDGDGTVHAQAEALLAESGDENVREIARFALAETSRALCTPKR